MVLLYVMWRDFIFTFILTVDGEQNLDNQNLKIFLIKLDKFCISMFWFSEFRHVPLAFNIRKLGLIKYFIGGLR